MGCRTWKIKIKYCPWPFSDTALSISKVELRGATAEASWPFQNPYHQVHWEMDQWTGALRQSCQHTDTFLSNWRFKAETVQTIDSPSHLPPHNWQVPVTELLGKSSPGQNPRAQREVHRPLLNKGGGGTSLLGQWLRINVKPVHRI